MATAKQTKDELLVENAILKYNEQVRLMLKQEVAPLAESIKAVDKRIVVLEQDVVEIKEVVEPFSKIRNRIWFIIIALSLIVGIAGDQITNWITSLIVK